MAVRPYTIEHNDNGFIETVTVGDMTYTEVEAKRQAIRDKYAVVQNDIDKAKTVEELKTIISNL